MEKMECKHCSFESGSLIGIWHHIAKTHNTKPTKRDFKFMVKHCYCGQAVRLAVRFVIMLPILLVLLVTYPFWWLHEQFNDIF
jgi:hypothetical protein